MHSDLVTQVVAKYGLEQAQAQREVDAVRTLIDNVTAYLFEAEFVPRTADALRKTEVTFYPWCTGCRIPVHACLFTGSLSLGRGLSGACRCRESNCENENKDRHKAFHGASPSICVPASRILASAGGTYFCQAPGLGSSLDFTGSPSRSV
jgi:hypothetical protein